MNLTNTGDQPPPLVDQHIDQASAPHGISYLHLEAFDLTEELVEGHINNTI